MKFENMSGTQIGCLVQHKEISPVEVTEYFLKRISDRNKHINAFVYIDEDSALNEARQLEYRIMHGEQVGLFAGVPIALKDFLDSKIGWNHTKGGVKSLLLPDLKNSQFYSAAKRAGAIALGKTNSPSFGFSGTCDNKLFGPTKNPFDTMFNSGGSSGGTAAAVADGLIPLGEGGDAGGSIRIPAAWCNCFGFKASANAVESFWGPDGLKVTHPCCTNGAITKTVNDSAAILGYMTGINYMSMRNRSIKGMKIGVTYDFNLYPKDDRMVELIKKTCKQLEEAGTIIEPIDFEFHYTLNEFAELWCKSISIGTAIELEYYKNKFGIDLYGYNSEDVSEEFLHWNNIAKSSTIFDFVVWRDMLNDIKKNFNNIFNKYDLIVSPVTCCMPVLNKTNGNTRGPELIDDIEINNVIGFAETFLVNFIGNPAASIPIGYIDNLPVGMQIIGNAKGDKDVFTLSYALENLQPWSYENCRI